MIAPLIIETLLYIVLLYLFCGFVFAIAFIRNGIDKVDDSAHGSGFGFRLIIIPGIMVFWILLLKKWIKARQTRTPGENE